MLEAGNAGITLWMLQKHPQTPLAAFNGGTSLGQTYTQRTTASSPEKGIAERRGKENPS